MVDEHAIQKLIDRYLWSDSVDGLEYTINPDGTVDFICDMVNFRPFKHPHFPVKFGKIQGGLRAVRCEMTSLTNSPHSVTKGFMVSNNFLKTLDGSPRDVPGEFNVAGNKLTSLENGPESVGSYDCSMNHTLKSLKGMPAVINGSVAADRCGLTSLEGAPTHIGGDFDILDNPFVSLAGMPKHIGGRLIIKWSPSLPMMRLITANCNKIEVYGDDDQGRLGDIEQYFDHWADHAKINKNKALMGLQKDLIEGGYPGNARL